LTSEKLKTQASQLIIIYELTVGIYISAVFIKAMYYNYYLVIDLAEIYLAEIST